MKVTDISCSYYYHSASWQTEISHILKGDNTASFYNENYKQNSWYCLMVCGFLIIMCMCITLTELDEVF